MQFHLGGTGLPPFDEAEARAVSRVTELGTPVHCLDTRSLLESKRKANRPQDQADIQFLEAKLSDLLEAHDSHLKEWKKKMPRRNKLSQNNQADFVPRDGVGMVVLL